jgi:hypothetical protein
MSKDSIRWSAVVDLLSTLAQQQQMKLLQCGRQRVPCLTEEDLWQPNDFPVLELDPIFRYEEGVWSGMLSALSAAKAAWHENKDPLEGILQ